MSYYGFNPWISTDTNEILNTITFEGQEIVERNAPELLLRFEAEEGAVAFSDSSGQDITSSCEMSASTCPTAGVMGRYGSALDFDGTDDELSTASGVTELAKGSFTIAAWIKTTGTAQAIVTKSDGDSTWEQGEKTFYLNASGQPTFVGYGNEFIRSTTVVNDGAWHHVAVVWAYASGTSGTGKIYIDGVDRTNNATTTYVANNADNPADTLAVGRPNRNSSEAPSHLRGTLDELAVFGRALSASEVAALKDARYNGTDGMVRPSEMLDYSMTVANNSANWPASTVYYGQVEGDFTGYEEIEPAARWKLNEASGTASFSDSSGNGRTATCSAAACPTSGTSGYRGAAISLDGGDQVNLDAGLATTFSTGYAFGGWVYPTGIGTQNYQRIFTLMSTSTSTNAGDLLNDITYDLADHKFKSLNTAWAGGTDGDNTAPANQWYHVMVVVDLVSGVNVLYMNGEPLIDGIVNAPPTPANRALRLGDPITSDDSIVNNNGTLPFQGKVDDVEVYNRVLTQQDVQRIMVEQLPRIPSDLPFSVYDVPTLGSTTIEQSFQVPSTQVSGTFRLSQVAEAALDISDETAVVYDPGIRAHFDEPTQVINLVQYQHAYSGISSQGLAMIRCAGSTGGGCADLVADFAGNAAQFNGTNQYMLWDSYIDTGPWAIGVWIKPTHSGNGTYAILGGDLSSGSAPSLFINSSNQLGLGFASNGSWNTSYTPGGTVPRNMWSHVAATHDGAGNYQLYLNGAPVGNDNAIPAGTIAQAASTTYLGRIGAGYNLFQGRIDNLVTFKVKLSPGEIRTLSTLTDLSLHAQYNFDDPPGDTTFTDLAGVLGDGSCSGAACPTMGMRGKVNRAARFDGGDLVSALRLPLYWKDDATEYSLAAWVKVQQGAIAEAKGQHRPFRLWNNRYDNGYSTSGSWENYDDVTLFTGPAADEWAHMVVTYGDNNTRNKIYLNGELVVTTGAGSAFNPTSTLPLRIGNKVIGYIDEVQYYNRALSAAEALALYQTSAPILQFEFEEATGVTSFDDQSDNDTDGTLTGSVVPGLRGRVGNGALFAGDGAVTIASATKVGALTSGYAIMGWIKPQDVEGLQRLIAAGRTTSTNGFGFGLNGDRLLLSAFGVQDYQSSAMVANNTWQHVAVVVDQSYNASFYLDGAFVDVIAGSAPTLANGDDALYMGATTAAGSAALSEQYTGQLDELYVYGRALSAAEVSHAYYNQFRWFRKQHDSTFTVDTDAPTIELLNTATRWPNDYIQLSVATNDATSSVWSFEYGLKAPGASTFTWQSAPACADARSGVLWCPSFDPVALAGEGAYQLQFRAADAVGNQTTSAATTIYVDDTPPAASASYSDTWVQANQTAVDELSWSINLTGTISDPAIGAVAGSGVVSSTVLVALLDERGTLQGGAAQLASVSGTTWSIAYQLIGPRPTGRYTMQISAADGVGNAIADQVVGSILLDARAPSIDVVQDTLSGAVISDNLTLDGVLSEHPAPSGAVARFHFEEPGGATSFADASGTVGVASCAGSCPTSTSGIFGGALHFNGSARLTVPATDSLNLSSGTISAWVRPTWNAGANGYDPTLLALGDGASRRYSLHISDGLNGLLLDNGATVSQLPMSVAPNAWHHIAIVQSGAEWTGYLDGVALGSVAQPFGTDSGAPLAIGATLGGTKGLVGDIDELAIFSHALTAEEVYALAQSQVAGVARAEVWLEPADVMLPVTSTLVSLDVEDPSGSASFADESGSGRSASCTNCPSVVAGQFGQAITFDGVNDTLTISGAASMNLSRFTQSVWIYPTSSDTAFHGILGYDPGNTARRAPSLYLFQQTRVQAGFGDGTGWNAFSTSGGITPNAWNHIAATFDGTTYRIYINGVQTANTSAFAGKTPYPISQLNVGKIDNYFQGSLDRVRVFDRALSAAEVGMLASAWQPATLSTTGTPLATWGYTLPTGLEGLYQLRLRGSDERGNLGGDRIVWRGMLDDVAPRMQLSATHVGGGLAASTIYTITANDTFLDPALSTPCGTWETTSASHAWLGQTIALTQTCQVAGHQQGIVSATAADSAANTTTITLALPLATQQSGVLITSPTGSIASGAPISVTGGAYATAGIQKIELRANGALVATVPYTGGETNITWTMGWTPPASGSYTLVAVLTDQQGNTFTDQQMVTALAAYNLSVSASAGGIVTSSPAGIRCEASSSAADCAKLYIAGTVVTLTATPNVGATFDGWSGACSTTSDTCVVTLDQARAVTASFSSIAAPQQTIFLPLMRR